jgi:electron transport complex protein RnfC
LGGAGFPTALKLRNAQKIDTLIINAVECEPYISCDDALIQQYAEEISQGILLLINSLG